jgi:hypothetical protein
MAGERRTLLCLYLGPAEVAECTIGVRLRRDTAGWQLSEMQVLTFVETSAAHQKILSLRNIVAKKKELPTMQFRFVGFIVTENGCRVCAR